MTSVLAQPIEIPSQRSRSWMMSIWLHPRFTFKQIVVQAKSVWLIPLLLFSIAVLGNVIVNGHLKQLAAQNGEVILPPDFQYYSPEQQQQLMTAIQATSGPAFLYILPVLGRIGTVWIIWLITGSLLHLIMTLSGGRGNTSRALDIVAWASVPLILREFIRAIAITIAKEPIQYPGLSGFAPAGIDRGESPHNRNVIPSGYLCHLVRCLTGDCRPVLWGVERPEIMVCGCYYDLHPDPTCADVWAHAGKARPATNHKTLLLLILPCWSHISRCLI